VTLDIFINEPNSIKRCTRALSEFCFFNRKLLGVVEKTAARPSNGENSPGRQGRRRPIWML